VRQLSSKITAPAGGSAGSKYSASHTAAIIATTAIAKTVRSRFDKNATERLIREMCCASEGGNPCREGIEQWNFKILNDIDRNRPYDGSGTAIARR